MWDLRQASLQHPHTYAHIPMHPDNTHVTGDSNKRLKTIISSWKNYVTFFSFSQYIPCPPQICKGSISLQYITRKEVLKIKTIILANNLFLWKSNLHNQPPGWGLVEPVCLFITHGILYIFETQNHISGIIDTSERAIIYWLCSRAGEDVAEERAQVSNCTGLSPVQSLLVHVTLARIRCMNSVSLS